MSNLYIAARLQAIKDIVNTSCQDEKDIANICDFCDEIHTEIQRRIDNVVKELEAIKGYACYGINCDECKYTHACFEGEKSEEMAIDKAIEIVKKSGVSDDVCEWKKSEEYPFDWMVGCDGCEVHHRQGDYCPRCGKKILCKE